ncbi:AAA family ATPase [Vibrio parahaemolyticus]|uniref:hypothetical protein n=1 Tax=Vibrio parahaemolyticus TaxID=670 RepID=UPI00111C15E8|nr:hypothetical protein [Vibrio parahaemolyticus]EJG0618019.1 hypothetical protein [Vibrio parahaemolyticus]EJG0636241.1 hypothetical protein [Vibrio parahaemolyticus]EJG0685583.1 hypothetical protein [Vibrio parahaemolyticus]EJG0698982.1 hypothetical protein [Vibrio parahaemolyticus]EJG0726291.1 hypothetical protein [Vibrio parahaemolyticus]
MLTVEGLPNSFRWEDDGINWVTNYLKAKASTFSTNEKISDLLQQYFNSQISLVETREQFEILIADILSTGDAGKLFIGKLSATWRARHARQGKKHYNLSLDSDTYKNLKSLAKNNSTPNASIKQTLTELINDEYQTKIAANRKKKLEVRAAADHEAKLAAKGTQRKIDYLTQRVESLEEQLNQQPQKSLIGDESSTSLEELKKRLEEMESQNQELLKEVSKYAKENSKLKMQLYLPSTVSETPEQNHEAAQLQADLENNTSGAINHQSPKEELSQSSPDLTQDTNHNQDKNSTGEALLDSEPQGPMLQSAWGALKANRD